jgi:hypothetical protein
MGLKITIGKEEITEYDRCRFELTNNTLIMKNIITGTQMNLPDGSQEKTIPEKHIIKLRKYLTEHKRKVVV